MGVRFRTCGSCSPNPAIPARPVVCQTSRSECRGHWIARTRDLRSTNRDSGQKSQTQTRRRPATTEKTIRPSSTDCTVVSYSAICWPRLVSVRDQRRPHCHRKQPHPEVHQSGIRKRVDATTLEQLTPRSESWSAASSRNTATHPCHKGLAQTQSSHLVPESKR